MAFRDNSGEAVFNVSIAYALEIQKDFNIAKYYFDTNNGAMWYKKLWDIHRQIAPILDASRRKEDHTNLEKINKAKNDVSKKFEELRAIPLYVQNNFLDDKFFKLLYEWEYALRYSGQSKGLFLAEKESRTSAIS